jgi:hypothetical protein
LSSATVPQRAGGTVACVLLGIKAQQCCAAASSNSAARFLIASDYVV